MDFYHLQENIKIWYRNRFFENCFRKLVHKSSEPLGNKIVDAITKSKDFKIGKLDENPRNIEEIIILQEKRWNMKQIEKSIIKMEYYKLPKLLNDSAVSKLVTKK